MNGAGLHQHRLLELTVSCCMACSHKSAALLLAHDGGALKVFESCIQQPLHKGYEHTYEHPPRLHLAAKCNIRSHHMLTILQHLANAGAAGIINAHSVQSLRECSTLQVNQYLLYSWTSYKQFTAPM